MPRNPPSLFFRRLGYGSIRVPHRVAPSSSIQGFPCRYTAASRHACWAGWCTSRRRLPKSSLCGLCCRRWYSCGPIQIHPRQQHQGKISSATAIWAFGSTRPIADTDACHGDTARGPPPRRSRGLPEVTAPHRATACAFPLPPPATRHGGLRPCTRR